ncbi:hypothetical protein PAENI_28090 [Paenibacillus sp. B2(2019)]|nr:hypothetical protein PAENI_28090 [Paenibacillus sp. B2(2019)]
MDFYREKRFKSRNLRITAIGSPNIPRKCFLLDQPNLGRSLVQGRKGHDIVGRIHSRGTHQCAAAL